MNSRVLAVMAILVVVLSFLTASDALFAAAFTLFAMAAATNEAEEKDE